MMPVLERYERDPMFRALVDQMLCVIQDQQMTPTEVREAAMLAQLMFEQRNPRPAFFRLDDVIQRKV